MFQEIMGPNKGYSKIVLLLILFTGVLSILGLVTMLVHHEVELFD